MSNLNVLMVEHDDGQVRAIRYPPDRLDDVNDVIADMIAEGEIDLTTGIQLIETAVATWTQDVALGIVGAPPGNDEPSDD